MSGVLWLATFYGFACIISIGRTGYALVTDESMMKCSLWVALTLGLAFILEFYSDLDASFNTVMIAFIELFARVF